MQHYGLYLCDLRLSHDILLEKRVNKQAAVDLARQKNAELLAEHAGKTPAQLLALPLYYACRIHHGRRGRAS